MYSANGGTFDFKDLAVDDRFLTLSRCIFVHPCGELWVETKKIGYSAGMVAMPVGKEYVRQFDG